MSDLINTQAYYKHKRTGRAILVKAVFSNVKDGHVQRKAEVWDISRFRPRYVLVEHVAKNYREVSWEEVLKIQ